MERICLHGHVTGRVQGVCFRAFAQGQAEQLKVTGWARNLADGRVEVLLCGERAAVTAVAERLACGPERARVEQVDLKPVNILVTKALGYGCDEEAIRLIQQGPKWERTTSNEQKGAYSISFKLQ